MIQHRANHFQTFCPFFKITKKNLWVKKMVTTSEPGPGPSSIKNFRQLNPFSVFFSQTEIHPINGHFCLPTTTKKNSSFSSCKYPSFFLGKISPSKRNIWENLSTLVINLNPVCFCFKKFFAFYIGYFRIFFFLCLSLYLWPHKPKDIIA